MKKVCKKCKLFVEGEVCPVCKTTNFTEIWQGRMFFLDVEKSEIAKKLKINAKGEYAIKTR